MCRWQADSYWAGLAAAVLPYVRADLIQLRNRDPPRGGCASIDDLDRLDHLLRRRVVNHVTGLGNEPQRAMRNFATEPDGVALNRWWRKATELALYEPGEGDGG
jgi:hypothetical protein